MFYQFMHTMRPIPLDIPRRYAGLNHCIFCCSYNRFSIPKSTINALTLATFALGNIIGTEIFLPKDAPDYIPGKIAVMVLLTVQIAVSYLLRWINLRMNKKKRATLEAEIARQGWTESEVQKQKERHAFADLTDKQ
jgi:MFS transporter, ACS family, allantoate permease